MEDTSYGAILLRTALSLIAVSVVAVLVLRKLGRRLPGGGGARAMRVLDRLATGPGREVLLVEIPGKVLVIASSEAGLSTLSEVAPEEAAEALRAAAETGDGGEGDGG